MNRAVSLLRRLLPWVVALGILAVLFRRAGGAELRQALAEADIALLLGATALCTVGMYLIDVLAFTRTISWFNCRIGFREVAPVKAASYLLNVLNYSAGTASVALWLNRQRAVPFLEAAAALLFLNVTDALVLVCFMAAAFPALDPPLSSGVGAIVLVAVGAFSGHLLYWRKGIDFLVLGRLRRWPIFKSFREANLGHYLQLAAVRIPFILLFVLNHWLGLLAFGVDVPFLTVLAYVPILSFIGTIPITVAGLGTVQAATVFLFAPWAPEATLLAFSLAMTVLLTAARALLGVPVFRRVSNELIASRTA